MAHTVRLDAREHLVHGRVRIKRAPASTPCSGGDAVLVPLEAEVRLTSGGAVLGSTRTRLNGDYTLLFNAPNATLCEAKSRCEQLDLLLHVLTDERDPYRRVNVTQRYAFAQEFAEVAHARRGDRWIWRQSLDIDAGETFPACAAQAELLHAHKTQFQGLQAHEFRDVLLEIGREAVGDFPLTLDEAGIALCYSVFLVLLCVVRCTSRRATTRTEARGVCVDASAQRTRSQVPTASRVPSDHIPGLRAPSDLFVDFEAPSPRRAGTPLCWARNHVHHQRQVHSIPVSSSIKERVPATRVSHDVDKIGLRRPLPPRPVALSSTATQTISSFVHAPESDITGRSRTRNATTAWSKAKQQ